MILGNQDDDGPKSMVVNLSPENLQQQSLDPDEQIQCISEGIIISAQQIE